MNRLSLFGLVLRALCEFLCYDIRHSVLGFRAVYVGNNRARLQRLKGTAQDHPSAIVQAVDLAQSFYFKPVRCLQRSVAAARLLQRHGVPAKVMIGFQADPFFSHAWVELHGRVLNDSPVYRKSLCTMEFV